MVLSLDQRIGCSPFLSRLAENGAYSIESDPDALQNKLTQLIDRLQARPFEDLDAQEQLLILSKKEFSYYWSLAELEQVSSQQQRGQWQTEFAQASIHFALSVSIQQLAKKNKAVAQAMQEGDCLLPGLFIFGMGKLGGTDLNFSSDVDLVAYFDPKLLAIPDMMGKGYVCHQVLTQMTKLLSQGGASNFIWRVDWRLRPNASATSLAMSTDAAEDYYYYHASPWHRLALMKARVIAGDYKAGELFLKSLESFIWRQNLDFRALDELAEIKQRINLEHPGLRAQRTWPDPIGDTIEGFNLKLGSGGIREVEFFVNAQQLLLGGRKMSLRTPNTVMALQALVQEELIQEQTGNDLTHAYQFLRRLENAVQIHSNQQTHLLPTGDSLKQEMLMLLGLNHWSELVVQLNQVRQLVNELFLSLFAEQEQGALGPLVWPDGLTATADQIVEGWENGFRAYGVSNSVRHRLRPLVHALAEYLNDGRDHSGPDLSDVVLRLDGFFKSMPQGEQYFRLLAESPNLLHSIVPPLLYSPAMTTLLTQSPHIIDCYVHDDWQYPQPFDSQYIHKTDDYGEQLERMRRFVNEHLYQLYQQFMRGLLKSDEFQLALSELAEHTLELALDVVRQGMGLDQVPITVIGMGKVALRKMSPMSDLDLIFVFDAKDTSLELASRFVSRLQTAIASSMREGILYELDTRLRPSGRSGAPTVSIDSFKIHHMERAHTWEHIALAPSRVVAGRREPQPLINELKHQVISTARDPYQLRVDARKMWQRIIEHRVGDTPLTHMNSKLRVGGLMQAEYLAACLVLGYDGPAIQPSDSPTSFDLDDLLRDRLPYYGLEELPEVIQFWRIQQLWERLLGKTGEPLISLRDSYFARLLEQSSCSGMDELLAKKKRYADYVDEGLSAFFNQANELDLKELEQWFEQTVKWS